MTKELSEKYVMTIVPNDNLFFGGGKTLNKDENQWLTTSIIPNESVFLGAICSTMLSQNIKRRQSYIERNEQESDPRNFLTLGKITLTDGQSSYVHAPLDLFIEDDYGRKEIVYGELKKNNCSEITTSERMMRYLFFNPCKNENERADNCFIDTNEYYNSYYKKSKYMAIKGMDYITNNSYKVGIKIKEDTGTVEDGMLYRVDLVEFNNMNFDKRFRDKQWGYNVEYMIDNNWWEDDTKNKEGKVLSDGYLKLGGENKVCKFTTKQNISMYNMKCYMQENTNKYIKLVVRKPVEFKESVYYPTFNSKCKINVIACSIGKSQHVGGFDIKLNMPKPMRNMIPAGSVYVLESDYFKGKKLYEISEYIESNVLLKEQDSGDSPFTKFDVVPMNYGIKEDI